jgi:hypothetical protein
VNGNITVTIPQAWVLAIVGVLMTGSAVIPRFIGGTVEARVYKLELQMDRHQAQAVIAKLDANGTLSVEEKRTMKLEELKVQDIERALRGLK